MLLLPQVYSDGVFSDTCFEIKILLATTPCSLLGILIAWITSQCYKNIGRDVRAVFLICEDNLNDLKVERGSYV